MTVRKRLGCAFCPGARKHIFEKDQCSFLKILPYCCCPSPLRSPFLSCTGVQDTKRGTWIFQCYNAKVCNTDHHQLAFSPVLLVQTDFTQLFFSDHLTKGHGEQEYKLCDMTPIIKINSGTKGIESKEEVFVPDSTPSFQNAECNRYYVNALHIIF